MFSGSKKFFEVKFENQYIRILVGGAIIIVLSMIFSSGDYNCSGSHIIEAALHGEAKPEAFLLKMLFTAVTLGVGFKGGEIVPTMFIGMMNHPMFEMFDMSSLRTGIMAGSNCPADLMREAAEKMQQLYPEYLGNMSAEAIIARTKQRYKACLCFSCATARAEKANQQTGGVDNGQAETNG